ncbi:MAG: helix-turn-helix domain-containing protein [Planctomycetota bacterium]|nr:helix-turn-helix domain-containing protein [Planctomycetota bacterium]
MLTVDNEYLKPPEIAKMLRVGGDSVLTWIRNGELRASDTTMGRGQRPRWRIRRADLESFLASRAATPEPKQTRRPRRQRPAEVIQFYE